jgi:RimJ/RimL family protein N-acetyltransferase
MKIEINKNVFETFPEFDSERLLFRKILLNDAKALFNIRTNKEVMKFMDTDPLKSISDSEKLIKSVDEAFKNGAGISWGIIEKSSSKFIGYYGFWKMIPEHCRAEIGYALDPDYWGKGYMLETLKAMIKFGFNEINLHSIEANVNPDNKSSRKALEKIGFKKEAYFRENFLFNNKFGDSVIYSLLEKDLINI